MPSTTTSAASEMTTATIPLALITALAGTVPKANSFYGSIAVPAVTSKVQIVKVAEETHRSARTRSQRGGDGEH